MEILIYGGPPWGLRISNDAELRPVVGKLLPGGRGELNGVRIGDLILSVDGIPVGSTVEAQELIQKANDQLQLKVTRTIDGYHSTVRKEKLSSSNQSSPIQDRKELRTISVPSTPVLPRTNPHFSRNSPLRQIKFDSQGIKGTTELKRRLFEGEASKSPATDRLLQRKIQMGYMHGVPSESTTGYDSVCGDFAGGAQTSSNRTSPLSSIMQEDIDEQTIHEDSDHHLKNTLTGPMHHHDPNQMFGEAGSSSQWEMKTENTNGKPADGEIEVPHRRSVAALRQAITTQLEMKAPAVAQNRNKLLGQDLDGRSTPTYNRASVKVYQDSGLEENPNKPYFGRVLDGPVAENKYYQGVPPPSYSLCHSPAPSSCYSEPQSKPPISPKKENKGIRNSFLNKIATGGLKEEEEEGEEDAGDGQTASDFYHSLYGGDGSQRTVNIIPQQSEIPSLTTNVDTVVPLNGKNPEENTVIVATTSINNPRITNETALEAEPQKEYIRPVSSEISSVPEDPKSSTNSSSASPRRISMDLESSDIFKSRSPAPFSAYSTNNSNHYATLRRNHSPVALSFPSFADKDSMDENQNVPAPFTSSMMTASMTSQGSQNQVPCSMDNFLLQSQLIDRSFSDKKEAVDREPERCAAASPAPYSMDQLQSALYNPVSASVTSDGVDLLSSAHYSAPQNDSEMSSWYKNMYKKMHKIDPETDSVLRHQLRDQSPALSTTIQRPLTPSSYVQRPPSRFECEVTPRRAKSVGRVVEAPVSSNQYAFERGRTAHFHLPSYKFRDEDRRALLTNGCRCVRGGVLRPEPSRRSEFGSRLGPTTMSCLRCHLPRKDPSWNEIEYLYKTIGSKEIQKEIEATNTQSRIAHRCISDRLESTAEELERFIQSLDISWKRSKSQPIINLKREKESSPLNIADEIAELKKISKEELMFRQKAEKLTEELENERQRRHGYIPSSAPSLQKNFDRFESLMNDYGGPSTTSRDPPKNINTAVRTATAVHQFMAKSARELSLNKGEVIRIHRDVDSNWLEGERNGKIGIFPKSYVQMNDPLDTNVVRLRVVYPFTARNSNELSLKLGELLTYRRDIDANWIEGANHLAEIGIFPKSYVREEAERMEPTSSIIPDRPKTPKITTTVAEPIFDIEYESPPREIRPTVHFQPREISEPVRQPIENGRTNIERQEYHPPINSSHENYHLADSRHSAPAQYVPKRSATPDYHAPVRSSFAPSRPVDSKPSGMAQYVPKGSETYRAVYAYRPQKEDELELELDDIIFVVEKCDDGWFIGTLLRNGKFGTFPGNYVQRH